MLDGGVSPGVHAPEAVGNGLLERCLSTTRNTVSCCARF